jgi:hypothetical protein
MSLAPTNVDGEAILSRLSLAISGFARSGSHSVPSNLSLPSDNIDRNPWVCPKRPGNGPYLSRMSLVRGSVTRHLDPPLSIFPTSLAHTSDKLDTGILAPSSRPTA